MAAAALSGTSIAAQTGVAASVAPNSNGAPPHTAKVNRSFDYTHLGRDGADHISKMVTDELLARVPSLRQYLVP